MIQLVKEVIIIEANINHIDEELLKFGIQTRKENGEYRDFSEILFDVCDALETIKSNSTKEVYEAQKEYLAQLIYGKRRKNMLYGIVKD